MKKYLVIPDYVHSISDGDYHYITARQLIKLYGVPPSECVIVSSLKDIYYRGLEVNDLIVLRPLRNGLYKEFLEKENKDG